MQFISHKISFSDTITSKDGNVDCDQEGLNSLSFKNEGTVNVTINSVTLQPGSERNYSVQDESNIITNFEYKFQVGPPGTRKLVITRGKRIKSVVEIANGKNC